jgi:adenylate cyclase
MAQEDADQSAASIGTSALLDGLEGEARRDRAELVAWLMRRGFTADEIAASVTPMLLPANRVMGDDGVYVSAREMAHATGIDLELLQGMQRAAGLPRIDDPDAAVLPRAEPRRKPSTFSTSVSIQMTCLPLSGCSRRDYAVEPP